MIKHILFKFIFSYIFAMVLFTSAGLDRLAFALATQDPNSPTACNLTDFTDFFSSQGGKTYALTKKKMTWSNASALAMANKGRLVVVKDLETNAELIEKLALSFTNMSSATAPSGGAKAWIGLSDPDSTIAYTMDGATPPQLIPDRFEWASSASDFKNWGTGQPDNACTTTEKGISIDKNCFGEDWAAMSQDGTWSDEGNHSYTPVTAKGIVEWTSELDCVQSVIAPTTTEEDQDTMGMDTTTPGTAYCANQANNNLQPCIKTADGADICNQDAAACNANYDPPVCPSGSILDVNRDMCQAVPTIVCGVGYSWDASIDRCVKNVICPEGGVLNTNTDKCEKLVINNCQDGYLYDSNPDSPTFDKCVKAVECPNGAFNVSKDRCEAPPAWDCGLIGFSYNTNSGKCEASPVCAPGTTYHTGNNRCEAALQNCPAGYAYNAALDKCVTSVVCPSGGALNGGTDKCEVISTISCPAGTAYNGSTGKCEAAPQCTPPAAYSSLYDICLTPPSSAICPIGYSYLEAVGSCVATPTCVGGFYNTSTDRCETTASFSCSDASYTFNSTSGRCEKVPACVPGMSYNATYNVCTQSITPTCQDGYNFIVERNRCEKVPECSQGIYNTVTNKCESSSSSPTPATAVVVDKYDIPLYKCTQNVYCDTAKLYSENGPSRVILGYISSTVTSQPIYKCTNGVFCSIGNLSVNSSAGWSLIGYVPVNPPNGTPVKSCINNVYCSRYDLSPGLGGSGGYQTYGSISTDVGTTTTYTCPNGKFLTADNMCISGYAATPVASAIYDKPVYAMSDALFDTNFGPLYGYVSRTSFTGSKPVYVTSSQIHKSGSVLFGYISNSPLPSGMEVDTDILGVQTILGTGVVVNGTLFGYVAKTSGTQSSYNCPSGGTLVGTVCQSESITSTNPTCSNGTMDYTVDVCYAAYTPTCSLGVYDVPTGLCIAAPVCSNGALDGSVDKCFQAAPAACPAGYTVSGSICFASASCSAGGALNGSLNYCTTLVDWSCPGGYLYSSGIGQCYQTASCGAGSLNTTADVCQQSISLVCPGDYILNGSTCQAVPTCTGTGNYSAGLNLCDNGANLCGVLAFDAAADRCYQTADCGGGVLDTLTDKCQASATVNCGGMIWDSSAGSCYSNPVCSSGAYATEFNSCLSTLSKDCGTYFIKDISTCQIDPPCPSDPGFSLAATTSYTPGLDKCVSQTQHDCATGTTYNSLPILKCEAVPFCDEGLYTPDTNQCFSNQYACPIGDYQCLAPQGGTSAKSCPGDTTLSVTGTRCETPPGSACPTGTYDPASSQCLTNLGPVAPTCNGNTPSRDGDKCWGPLVEVAATQCSPNSCTGNLSDFIETDDTESGENDKKDDGSLDENGACSGNFYIFNGKDSRCVLNDSRSAIVGITKIVVIIAASIVTGGSAMAMFLVSAASSVAGDAAMGNLGAGTLISVGVSAVAAFAGPALSAAGQYLGVTAPAVTTATTSIATTAGQGVSTAVTPIATSTVTNAVVGAVTTTTQQVTVTAVGTLGEITTKTFIESAITMGGQTLYSATQTAATLTPSALSTAWQAAQDAAPEMAAGGMSGAFKSTKCCYPDKLSPSCKPEEIRMWSMVRDKKCVEVGSYCSKKWLGSCVQTKKTFCCFTNKLARIIQEQGREQLIDFSTEGWGSAKSPNCRGFLPTEFSQLSFTSMDLTEYIEDFQDAVSDTSGFMEDYLVNMTNTSEIKATTAAGQ